MDPNRLRERFDKLGVWEREGQRAPHKPLLLLLALGHWVAGDRTDLSFAALSAELLPLLKEFGPPRRSLHPEYPFWWLQSDGVWAVRADRAMKPRTGSTNPAKRELLAANAKGGFTEDVKAALVADPALVDQLTASLLAAHFPDSLHSDILAAVGLDHPLALGQRPRDRSFRQRVLTAYEHRTRPADHVIDG